MSGLQITQTIAALPDTPNDQTTFYSGGTDRLDVVAIGFDVRLELIVDRRPLAEVPIRCRAGLHKSITGLSIAYRPHGVDGFRLSNWTPGSTAACDVEAYGT